MNENCEITTTVPAVSVVVATYNREGPLLQLLELLAAQDLPRNEFDVVIVDDESERPVEAAIDAPNRPYHCRVIRRTNGGPGVARDTGIRLAAGDIVVIIDDDMYVPPSFLHAHLRAHQAGADVVLGHIREPKDQQLPLFERFHQQALDRFVASHRAGTARVEGVRLCTGNVSFRKELYERVGGFDLTLRRCEDRDLGVRFEEAGARLVWSEHAWSEHHSDHVDPSVWLRRNRLYGELDERIARKHPHRPDVHPWAFLRVLPRISLPLVVLSALLPPVGRRIASMSYRVAAQLDRRRASRFAMVGASLSYGMSYFAGVGEGIGAPRRVDRVACSIRNHRRRVARVDATEFDDVLSTKSSVVSLSGSVTATQSSSSSVATTSRGVR